MSKKYNKVYTIVIDGEEKAFRLSANTLIKLKKLGIDINDNKQMGDIENALQFVYLGLVDKEEYATYEEMAEAIEISEIPKVMKKVSEIIEGIDSKN